MHSHLCSQLAVTLLSPSPLCLLSFCCLSSWPRTNLSSSHLGTSSPPSPRVSHTSLLIISATVPGLHAQMCLAFFAPVALRQAGSCQNMANTGKAPCFPSQRLYPWHRATVCHEAPWWCPSHVCWDLAVSQCKWNVGSNKRKHILVKDDVRLLIWRISINLPVTRKPKQQTSEKARHRSKEPQL